MAAKKKAAVNAGTKEAGLIEMGKFYFMNNKHDQAIGEFRKALELNPGNAEVYYNIGLVYETRNETENAREMFRKALAIDPDYAIAREHLNRIVGL